MYENVYQLLVGVKKYRSVTMAKKVLVECLNDMISFFEKSHVSEELLIFLEDPKGLFPINEKILSESSYDYTITSSGLLLEVFNIAGILGLETMVYQLEEEIMAYYSHIKYQENLGQEELTQILNLLETMKGVIAD